MRRLFPVEWVALAATLLLYGPPDARSQTPTKFKNIKVLAALTDAQINREMQAWTKQIGEKCTYCHEGSDYASDANPKKDVARKMAQMVLDINKEYLEGKATCMLCHRGAAVPEIP
jgi:photosynthetic reaction center cytochrome c subunit